MSHPRREENDHDKKRKQYFEKKITIYPVKKINYNSILESSKTFMANSRKGCDLFYRYLLVNLIKALNILL